MNDDSPSLVVRHRHAVRAALVGLAFAMALASPSIPVRFAPEELVAPDDDAARANAAIEAAFGPEEQALLVLVQAEDVLAPEVFDWSHAMARALARLPGVARVESLGTTPLPRLLRDDELTLDALEESAEQRARRERAEDAIAALVSADPRRFPEGLASLAARERGPIRIAPLVAGERPTDEERAAIAAIVANSGIVRGRLISEDRRLLAVLAVLEPGADEAVQGDVVRAALARIAAVPAPAGVRADLGGLPAMRATMLEALRRDGLVLIALAAMGSVVVLALGMRSLAGVLLPVVTVGISVAIWLGVMGWAREPINLLTNMIPPLLVTIGIADAVHMTLRYREEIVACGGDRFRAATRTLRTMWLACFVTSFTTAIGFGALLLQQTAILRRFGLIAACATMLSYGVTVLFVPASLPDVHLGNGARSPSRGGSARGVSARGVSARGLERAVASIATATARRPWTTIGASALLFVVSLWIARGVVVDSALLDQFDRESDVARVTRLLEEHLGGIRALSVAIEAEPGRFWTPRGISEIERLASWLRGEGVVLRVTTHADWLREAFSLVTAEPPNALGFTSEAQARALADLVSSGDVDPLARFVTRDGSHVRIDVRLADRGASRILEMLERFERHAVQVVPGARVRFGGEAWDASRGLDRIVRSLGSLGSAVAAIFLVMTLLFRSVRLGLLSVPPNALPLAATLAYMALRGIPLNAATVIVFTVTVGLAVDGATHVIARFREQGGEARPIEEAVVGALRTSGRGVVISSMTLLLGYGALLFSAFAPVRLFGELSAVAIGGSLLAQLVLLPALLAVGAKPSGRGPARVADGPERAGAACGE